MKPHVSHDVTERRDNVLVSFAELAALCGVAITMPVLDVFGRSPEVFIEAKANRIDLWLFAGVVSFGTPLLATVIELIIGAVFGTTARRYLHLAIVGVLGLVIALRAIRLSTGVEAMPLLTLSVTASALLVYGRAKFSWVKQWLSVGAFAPVLVAVTFLFFSNAHSLALAQDKKVSTPVSAAPTTVERPPIVLLVLDELPTRSLLDSNGNVDAERFPGFASVAAESTWFRNTTSVGSLTVNAVPSILTGNYPAATEVAPVAQNHPDNVFRLLGNGYRFNVSELVTELCAVPRCDIAHKENAPTKSTVAKPNDPAPVVAPKAKRASPLAKLLRRVRVEFPSMIALHDVEVLQDVTHEELVDVPAVTATSTPTAVDLEDVTPTASEPSTGDKQTLQPSRFSDWLGNMDADAKHPSFSMLHVTLPHHPYRHDADGLAYAVPGGFRHVLGIFEAEWTEDPGAAISLKQRHLLQVRYVDTLVAALRDRLIRLGTWDDTIVIVTADHGAAFEPGGTFREWTTAGSVDILGVPLFIHGPGFNAGKIDDRPVQAVDIAPTIAELSGIAVPWTVDGISLTTLGNIVRNSHLVETSDYPDYALTNVDVSRHLEQLLARRPAPGTDGGDDLTILRAGASGNLIGKSVSDLSIAADAGGVTIDFPTDGEFVTTEGLLPAFITGYLSQGGSNQTVVVAVDGRIAATALTFGWKGESHRARFAALIPPAWMQGDGHDVSFYVLTGNGALAQLG